MKLGDEVRVLYGTKIGEVGRIVSIREERRPVFRSGLVFGGATGFAGYARGSIEFRVAFDDGEEISYHPDEVTPKCLPHT